MWFVREKIQRGMLISSQKHFQEGKIFIISNDSSLNFTIHSSSNSHELLEICL